MNAGVRCLGVERDSVLVQQVSELLLRADMSLLHMRPFGKPDSAVRCSDIVGFLCLLFLTEGCSGFADF